MNTPRLLFLFLLVLTACARHPQAAPPAEIQPAQAAPPAQEYTDLSTAYGQLLGFRDDPLFIRHRFTANSPHAGWLDQVRAIGRRPGHSPEGPRLLAMLAVAIRQHGPDSPTARDFTTRFERELRLLRDAPASQPTPPPQPAPDTTRPEDSAVVSILYTGDTQGVLYPQPVLDSSVGGLSRRLPLLAKLRAANPNAVLLDAGDAFTSSGEQAMRNNSAMVAAMNRMHYDAMGLGVHDLGMGETAYDLALLNLLRRGAFLRRLDQAREVLHATLGSRRDVLGAGVTDHTGCEKPVKIGVFLFYRDQAVGREQDRTLEGLKLLILMPPGAAVVAHEMAVFLEGRVIIGGEHFTMGIDIHPGTLCLFQEFFHIFKVVARD